jgi:predicted site-specific integrase-resolvase
MTTDRLTGAQVAAMLGISRSTVYRRAREGCIPWDWRQDTIAPLVGVVTKRQRGPKRDRYSVRYTAGRHRFERKITG